MATDDPAQRLLEMIGQASIEVARQAASARFTQSILECMRQEAIGLEPAIVMVRDMAHLITEIEPLDTGETPEQRDMLRSLLFETFDDVAEVLRYRVEQARELVALADQGGK